MKILVITGDRVNGSNWHRVITPNAVLARNYSDVEILYISGIHALPDEQLRQYELCIIHYAYYDHSQLRRMRGLGLRIVMDFDDSWHLERHHFNYEDWNNYKIYKIIEETAQYADLLTCTTPILATKLKALGRPVAVLPNGLDPEDNQWEPATGSGGGFKVIYTGLLSHTEDLAMVSGIQKNFHVAIHEGFKGVYGDGWRYFGSEDVTNYGRLYDSYDATIAPLTTHNFNRYKSEIKMIEAGFKKIPIVVSDVPPYTLLANSENCLRVRKPRFKNWVKALSRLRDNPSLREDLAETLYSQVKEKYDLNKISHKRKEIYDNLLR